MYDFQYVYVLQKSTSLRREVQRTRVYARKQISKGGFTWECEVIGMSHHIFCEALSYHECLSCLSPAYFSPEVVIDLNARGESVFSAGSAYWHAETEMKIKDIIWLPDPDTCDIWYDFGEGAITAIRMSEKGFLTYHGYPERGIVLITKTEVAVHG